VTGPAPRVAIVTGGTRGLGAAVTTRLNAQGVRVVAVYRSDDEAAAKLQHGVETPALLDVRRADVSDPEACAAPSESVFTRYGRIDHLVRSPRTAARTSP
jgi:NAD(P)-dependent dehydrogenase (short-subunit alcohol dehydrogenase family)